MKTINTKENQVTLHTKDTIIKEDIQGGAIASLEVFYGTIEVV